MRRRRGSARGDLAYLTIRTAVQSSHRIPGRSADTSPLLHLPCTTPARVAPRLPSRRRSRTPPGPPPCCTALRCIPSPGGPAWPPRRPGMRGAAWAAGTAPPRAAAASRLPGREREDEARGSAEERGEIREREGTRCQPGLRTQRPPGSGLRDAAAGRERTE